VREASTESSPGNPLGPEFTLSPSSLNDNHFLSYSIEPTCRRLPFRSASPRASPPQAYLLAKDVIYLVDKPKFSWTLPALKALEAEFRIQVVGGMRTVNAEAAKAVQAAGIKNVGLLSKIDFYKMLSSSFVLVGVGQPRISPSPWDALCMGVPVGQISSGADVADSI
jgi:hypothetical protein